MNLASGIFTAPAGVYFFSWSGIGNPGSYFNSGLYVNGNRIGSGHSGIGTGSEYHTFSLQSVLQLKAGDKVSLQIYEGGSFLFEDNRHFTHFTGFLMKAV